MHAKVRAILEREIDKLDTLSQLPSALDLEHVQRLAALVRCLSAVSDPAKIPPIPSPDSASHSSFSNPQISTADLIREVLNTVQLPPGDGAAREFVDDRPAGVAADSEHG